VVPGSDKLRLVKIGPYEAEEKEQALKLVTAFIAAGGHGVSQRTRKWCPRIDYLAT